MVDSLIRYLLRRGLRRGLLGGETAWLVLGGAALAARAALKVMRAKPDVVFKEAMGTGEQYVITNRPPPGRRGGHNGRRVGPSPQP